MRTCFELPNAAYPIKLEQQNSGRFRVTYGKQVVRGLDYARAAKELGEAIMHALACEGKFDDTGDDE